MLRSPKILTAALPRVYPRTSAVLSPSRFHGRLYSAQIHSKLEKDSHGTKDGEKSTAGTFTAGNAALFVGASVGSGLLGYVLAQTPTHESLDARTAANVPDSPNFGSPLEFQKAISELKATFNDESAVSTDPEDLRVHGFSENDYYPGMFF